MSEVRESQADWPCVFSRVREVKDRDGIGLELLVALNILLNRTTSTFAGASGETGGSNQGFRLFPIRGEFAYDDCNVLPEGLLTWTNIGGLTR